MLILTQPNGGKSAALNNAILHAKHEILIAVDADTIFRTGTIQSLVRHFSDPKIGAVSGNARVGNRKRWITRFQSIEYIYGFNLDRRALDLLNAITVVPGAVGAWRKKLILDLGGFGHDTLAEDTDLTLAIRRLGYRIRYEQDAIAYTEAPEDTKGLAKQRFRWAFGTLQAAWKHRDAMFVPRYGTLGFVALPSIWLFQVLLSALSPFADIYLIISLVLRQRRDCTRLLPRVLCARVTHGISGVRAGRLSRLGILTSALLPTHLLSPADALRAGEVASVCDARPPGGLGQARAAGHRAASALRQSANRVTINSADAQGVLRLVGDAAASS